MFSRGIMLEYHLQHNHFPPVSLMFVESAEKAIEYVGQSEYDAPVKMPNGITLPARQIVEELHLECFLDGDDGGEWDELEA